jgi:minor histocompatibility antigen H13
MLGLGDIVIPGIFVALCLKYDLDRRLKLASQKENSTTNVKTPIFNAALLGYLIGIVVTYAVMIIF